MRHPLPRAVLAASFALLAACADDAPAPTAPAAPPAAAGQGPQVPDRSQHRPGTLADLPDAELWRYVAAGEGRAAVGLKSPGANRGVYRGRVLVSGADWSRGRAAVVAQRGVTLLRADTLLPVLEVRLDGPAALAAVRKLPFVDYVEPVFGDPLPQQFAGVGGCGWGAPGRATASTPRPATCTRSGGRPCASPRRGR